MWRKFLLPPHKRMYNFETLQSHIFDIFCGVLLSNFANFKGAFSSSVEGFSLTGQCKKI